MVRILLYNSGIDRVPSGQLERVVTVDRIKTDLKDFAQNEKSRFDLCGDKPFVKSYNESYAQEMKKYIADNKIDLCIMQEVCKRVLPTYSFLQYVASPYENLKNSVSEKLLIIGSTNRSIGLSSPLELNRITETPFETILCARVRIGDQSAHLINLHNRTGAHAANTILFHVHLIGLILSIISSEPTANIIMCGDYNSPGFDLSLSPTFEKDLGQFMGEIDTYLKPSDPAYKSDLMNNRRIQSDPFSQVCVNVLRGLMADLGFSKCLSPNKDCDFKSTVSALDKMCARSTFNLNDVVYYRLQSPNATITLDQAPQSVCFFHTKTSSHLPYILSVNLGTETGVQRKTSADSSPSAPADLRPIITKSFDLLKLS